MKSGLKIRELREKRNLKIGELGAEMGVSHQTITKWEESNPFPKGEKFQKICEFFGVDESFFEVEPEKEKDSALIEEYRTMLEFMKAEMTKLNDQNTILVKLLSSNFLRDNRAFGPDGKVIHLWPVIQKAAGY